MPTVQIVVLAAGMGTRLGAKPWPKPLTPLDDGRSILAQQMDNAREVFDDVRFLIVVGFKNEMVMEAAPEALFAYNDAYSETNTSKSLLKALVNTADGPVIWMNGDVVFDPEVLRRLVPFLEQDRSVIAVNTAVVGEEEVKYRSTRTAR